MFTLFVILIIVGVLFYYFNQKAKNQKRPLDAVANSLELTYPNPNKPLLHGKYQGRKVEIQEAYNQDSSTVTQFRLYFKTPLTAEFIAQPATNSPRKSGYSDVMSGDKSFDSEILLQGKDPEMVKEFFESPRLRAALENLFTRKDFSWPRINHKCIDVYLPRSCRSAECARSVLRDLVYFVDLFESADRYFSEKHAEKESKPKTIKPPALPTRKPFELKPNKVKPAVVKEAVVETKQPLAAEPTEPEVINQPVEQPVVEESKPKPKPVASGIPAGDAWELLIGEEPSNYEATKQFDKLLKGEKVNWHAKLEKFSPGSSDRNFGVSRGGWIAHIELPDHQDLKVKYHISDQRKQTLERQTTDSVWVEGKLLKFDSFTDTLYIDSGEEKKSNRTYKSNIVSYADKMASQTRRA